MKFETFWKFRTFRAQLTCIKSMPLWFVKQRLIKSKYLKRWTYHSKDLLNFLELILNFVLKDWYQTFVNNGPVSIGNQSNLTNLFTRKFLWSWWFFKLSVSAPNFSDPVICSQQTPVNWNQVSIEKLEIL